MYKSIFRTDHQKRPKRVALPFVRYKLYDEGSDGEKLTDDAIPVLSFLEKKSMSAVPPSSYPRDGVMPLFGEKDRNCPVQMATEIGKIISKSMLTALWDMEKLGECFEDFDISNVYVTPSGKVKFYNVKRMHKDEMESAKLRRMDKGKPQRDDKDEMKNASLRQMDKGKRQRDDKDKPQRDYREQLRHNYEAACDIISHLFSKCGPIPADIGHLISIIQGDVHSAMRSLYRLHASLVPITLWGAVYKKFYDHFKHMMNDDERKTLLQALREHEYILNWESEATRNVLLEKTFKFKKGRYDLPEVDPAVVLTEAQTMQRELKHVENFLDFIRHRIAHTMECYDKFQGYTAEGSDTATYIHYSVSSV